MACTLAVLGLKERAASGMGDDLLAEILIGLQLRDHAPGDRNDAAPPVLGVPDGKGGVLGADIPVIEAERFADPEAGRRDQAEQGRAGRATQSRPRGQRRCCGHDPLDLLLAVDVGSRTCDAPWSQSFGQNVVTLVDAVQPAGEAAHDGEPRAPCARARRPERGLPAQEQFRRDPFGALRVGKVDERLEDKAD